MLLFTRNFDDIPEVDVQEMKSGDIAILTCWGGPGNTPVERMSRENLGRIVTRFQEHLVGLEFAGWPYFFEKFKERNELFLVKIIPAGSLLQVGCYGSE